MIASSLRRQSTLDRYCRLFSHCHSPLGACPVSPAPCFAGPGWRMADYLANLGAIFTRAVIIIISPHSNNKQQCQHRNKVLAETQYTAPGLAKMERRKRNELCKPECGSPLLCSVAMNHILYLLYRNQSSVFFMSLKLPRIRSQTEQGSLIL